MFKRNFRNICLENLFGWEVSKLSFTGKIRTDFINSNSIIHPEANLHADAKISNHQKSREKITIGKKSQICAELLIYKHGGEIKMGDNAFIGEYSRIWSAKRISIGNRVLISHNVNIHDNNAHPLNANEEHFDFIHIFEEGLRPI